MKGSEMQYSLEAVKLEMPHHGNVVNFHESMEDLSNRLVEIRKRVANSDFTPTSDISYIEEICKFQFDQKWMEKLVEYREPVSAHIVGTGGTFVIGENQSLVGTDIGAKMWKGKMTYPVNKGMVFTNASLLAMVYKWMNFNRYEISHMYIAEFEKKTKQMKTQKDGRPKAKEYRIAHLPYERGEFLHMDWLWPNRNRPWIVSDALAFKTGKFYPANLPLSQDEKPRLYY
jgi:hypothetical protein